MFSNVFNAFLNIFYTAFDIVVISEPVRLTLGELTIGGLCIAFIFSLLFPWYYEDDEI